MCQQERGRRVSGGRSSPHAQTNLIPEMRNGDGQSGCHVPEMAVVSSKDTCAQGSTDSANRNAEIKVDGDQGGVTDGRDYSTRTRVNPSLRNGSTMSWPGGDEPRIGPGSRNITQTRRSSRLANRNAKGQPEGGGLEMGAGGHKAVGTRESSYSINRNGESRLDGDGGGAAVSHPQESHGAINRNAMSQPDNELRIAPSDHNNSYTQTSPNPANRNMRHHLEDDRPGIEGSPSGSTYAWYDPDSSRSPSPVNRNPKDPLEGGELGPAGSSSAIQRWENPGSKGGRRVRGPQRWRIARRGATTQGESSPESQDTKPSGLHTAMGRQELPSANRIEKDLGLFHLTCMTLPE